MAEEEDKKERENDEEEEVAIRYMARVLLPDDTEMAKRTAYWTASNYIHSEIGIDVECRGKKKCKYAHLPGCEHKRGTSHFIYYTAVLKLGVVCAIDRSPSFAKKNAWVALEFKVPKSNARALRKFLERQLRKPYRMPGVSFVLKRMIRCNLTLPIYRDRRVRPLSEEEVELALAVPDKEHWDCSELVCEALIVAGLLKRGHDVKDTELITPQEVYDALRNRHNPRRLLHWEFCDLQKIKK